MRATPLALALTLALAPAALADRWPQPLVAQAITVADAHWPQSPCRGAEQVDWTTGAQLDTIAATPTASGVWWLGWQQGACHTTIAWDRIAGADVTAQLRLLCALLEHEFGHMAGLPHSSDPADIMYPVVTGAADCTAAFPNEKRPSGSRPHRHHRDSRGTRRGARKSAG